MGKISAANWEGGRWSPNKININKQTSQQPIADPPFAGKNARNLDTLLPPLKRFLLSNRTPIVMMMDATFTWFLYLKLFWDKVGWSRAVSV